MKIFNKKGLLMPLMAILGANLAYAQEEGLLDVIYNLLGKLAFIDLSQIGGENPATFWAKFLLWLVVFTALYYSARTFIFKDSGQNKFAVITSIAVSLIVVLTIPADFIRQLFQVYGSIVVVLFIGLPVLGVALLSWKIKEAVGEDHPRIYHIVDAVVFYLILLALKAVNESIQAQWNLFAYTPWIGIAFAVCQLLMFWHIIMVFFAGSAGQALGEKNIDAGGFFNRFFPSFSKAGKSAAEKSKQDGSGRARPKVQAEESFTTRAIEILNDVIKTLKGFPDRVNKDRTDQATAMVDALIGKLNEVAKLEYNIYRTARKVTRDMSEDQRDESMRIGALAQLMRKNTRESIKTLEKLKESLGKMGPSLIIKSQRDKVIQSLEKIVAELGVMINKEKELEGE